MYFKQLYDNKLSQTSYLVGCQQTKEAIVIDPSRILDEYIKIAENEGYKITHATETHIHADFASGLRDAARKLGSALYVSDEGNEDWKYQNVPKNTVFLKDGDIINVGNVELKVIHTPGHTPESISFMLTDKGAGSEISMGMFTGDFLFVGDIGRPDLLEETTNAEGATEEGANQMFESIQKIKDLPELLQVWPGHGAGSPCGKSLGAVPLSTLGYEKVNNWVFNTEDQQSFIDELTSDQPEPPTYFSQMKKVNKEGLPEFNLKEVTVDTPDDLIGQVFDLRNKEEFNKSFMNGSYNIPYNKKFLQFAGWYIDYNQPMTVIADPKISEILQKDLASIGYDKLELIVPEEKADKYFNDSYENVSTEIFASDYKNAKVLDVRTAKEYSAGNVEDAAQVHYGHLLNKDLPFDKKDKIYVHCQSGIRSAIALSALKAKGYENAVNVEKGFIGIKKAMSSSKPAL
ncbi:MBL fold metallo-hydrolase [Salinicoccus sp. HZC-1]|uniref:MBL fold metallo-hydrolase n=1 Tax=Salinicoccus sp. HZC-1 TaxID=3385497 RepID=UPI00398A6DEC